MSQRIQPRGLLRAMSPSLKNKRDCLPGLFLGKGRLGAACWQLQTFQNWQSVCRTNPSSTYQVDLERETFEEWPSFEQVIFACAPSERSEEAYERIYLHALRNVLHHLSFEKMIFCSATSVYSENTGGIVTETAALDTENYRGRILVEAESLIKQYKDNYIILRFSGLVSDRPVLKKSLLPNHWGNTISLEEAALWVEKAVLYPHRCQETLNINSKTSLALPTSSPCYTGKRVNSQKAQEFFGAPK